MAVKVQQETEQLKVAIKKKKKERHMRTYKRWESSVKSHDFFSLEKTVE